MRAGRVLPLDMRIHEDSMRATRQARTFGMKTSVVTTAVPVRLRMVQNARCGMYESIGAGQGVPLGHTRHGEPPRRTRPARMLRHDGGRGRSGKGYW